MHRSLALKLRVLRAERALTIEQAAERAGVTPETISDAERGRRHPYLPTLRKLADAYEVPVEELLSAEEQEEPVPLGEPRQVREHARTREEAAFIIVHRLSRVEDPRGPTMLSVPTVLWNIPEEERERHRGFLREHYPEGYAEEELSPEAARELLAGSLS
jgi:transcriptional regulator with XRE-family HTH domain